MQHRGMMAGGEPYLTTAVASTPQPGNGYPTHAPALGSWQENAREETQHMPSLPKAPSKKRGKIKDINDRAIHGERIQKVADARRLWSRLDEAIRRGPYGPEEGFSMEVVEMARYGRDYVRIALQETMAKAWAYWRSLRRPKLHFGGNIVDFYDVYNQAVADYQVRHGKSNGAAEGNT